MLFQSVKMIEVAKDPRFWQYKKHYYYLKILKTS